jgi:hypothetical protein
MKGQIGLKKWNYFRGSPRRPNTGCELVLVQFNTMDPPQHEPPPLASPPAKRAKLENVSVILGGESFTIAAGAFGKLESFVTDKINHSDKKSR